MKFFTISYYLCFAVIFIQVKAYLDVVMDGFSGEFCLEVDPVRETNDVPYSPELVLILHVNYPLSVAEAGEITLGQQDLTTGNHNVSYKYLRTNMTHDLNVWFDGVRKKFLKSEVPRWYSVSTVREVLVLIQGHVRIISCTENEVIDPLPAKDIRTISSLLYRGKTFQNFGERSEAGDKFLSSGNEVTEKPKQEETQTKFFISDENAPTAQLQPQDVKPVSFISIDEVTSPPRKPEVNITVLSTLVSETLVNQKGAAFSGKRNISDVNETFRTSRKDPSSDSVDMHNTTKSVHVATWNIPATQQFVQAENISVSADNTSSQTAEPQLGNSIPARTVIGNGSTGGRVQSVLSCANEDCLEHHHDYTITLILVGGLGGLVLTAVVVSLVFHRKKKKLNLSKSHPKNNMHKLVASADAFGETQVMLETLEHNYEAGR